MCGVGNVWSRGEGQCVEYVVRVDLWIHCRRECEVQVEERRVEFDQLGIWLV